MPESRAMTGTASLCTRNQSMLIGEIFTLYVDLYAKSFTRTCDNTVYYWRRYCEQQWSNVSINEMNRFGVQRWLNELGEASGEVTANRAYSVLAAAINWAMKKGVIEIIRNPC